MIEYIVKVSPAKQQPELELLLCCARTQMPPECAERINHLVQQDINWDNLLKTARWHGVLPLLYWQLQEICPSSVPQDVLKELHSAFKSNLNKNLVLTGELLKLLNLFKSHNIPVLPLKGPVLALLAYQNIGLRRFVDLDILVSEELASQARRLLIDQGYQPEFNLTETQEPIYIRIRNEQMLWRKDTKITIDLHWSLMPKNFSFTRINTLAWEGYEQVNVAGNLVKTLSAETLLLFFCAHGSKHGWLRLSWICDLAEMIRSHPKLNWDWILAQADRLKTKRMTLLGLCLCQELLGTVLPDKVCQQVQSHPQIKILASEVQQQLFSETNEKNKYLKETNIYLKTMESFRDKLWFGFYTLMTPTPIEWEIVPLPMWLFPLYYLIRPMRLTIKRIKRL